MEHVAIAAPIIKDRAVGIIGHNPTDSYSIVNTCITSGAFVNISVWNEVGRYDEKMFIDSVDFEFCFRTRKAGYKIIQTRDVELIHSVGEGKIIHFLFFKYKIMEHSAFRCFYMAQNTIYYPKKHHLYLRLLRGNLRNLRHIIEVLFFETDKKNKIKAIFKGWLNGYFL